MLPSRNCFDSSGGEIANDSMFASLISLISFSTSALRWLIWSSTSFTWNTVNEISYKCKYNTKSIRIWSSLIGCMSVFQVSHLVKFFDFYSAFKNFYIYGSSFFKCWTEWFCPNLNLINFEKVKKWTLTFWLKRLVNRQSGIEGSAYMLSLRDLLF